MESFQCNKSNVIKVFFLLKRRFCSTDYVVQLVSGRKKCIFFSSMEENLENSSIVSIKIGKCIQDGL